MTATPPAVALSEVSKVTAAALLEWDVRRVAAIVARGTDASVYQDRQATAAAALAADLPVADWPRPVVYLFQAVLEVTMRPAAVVQFNVGPLGAAPAAGLSREALIRLADELGVLDNLREVAPRHWGGGEGGR